jgi:AcrR family transcriptional regulator
VDVTVSKRATPRERARESARAEARDIAARQLAEGGIEALSLKAIALELGLTGPAIYRYFANRNELLTELIIGAYDGLTEALGEAARSAAAQPAAEGFFAITFAFRGWALAQPHLFRLLFAPPVPRYDANAGLLVQSASRPMAVLLSALAGAAPGHPVRPPLSEPLAAQLSACTGPGGDISDPDVLYRGIIAWTRLYGLVALEIDGAFQSMGIDAAALYRREVEALIAA